MILTILFDLLIDLDFDLDLLLDFDIDWLPHFIKVLLFIIFPKLICNEGIKLFFLFIFLFS